MAKPYEQMTRAVVGLGEQAVLKGTMDRLDAVTGSLLGAVHLLILEGHTAATATEQMIQYLTGLQKQMQALPSPVPVADVLSGLRFSVEMTPQRQRPSPSARPSPPAEGYVRVRGRDHPGGEGPLAGQRIVFTGAMELPRDKAAALAADLGAQCSDSVSGKTTILVIGAPDPDGRLTGKQVKAQRLIAEGAQIQIMSEADFIAFCNSAEDQQE